MNFPEFDAIATNIRLEILPIVVEDAFLFGWTKKDHAQGALHLNKSMKHHQLQSYEKSDGSPCYCYV
jgi:hypothetical protein